MPNLTRRDLRDLLNLRLHWAWASRVREAFHGKGCVNPRRAVERLAPLLQAMPPIDLEVLEQRLDDAAQRLDRRLLRNAERKSQPTSPPC